MTRFHPALLTLLPCAALLACATTPDAPDGQGAVAQLSPVADQPIAGTARFEPGMFKRVTLTVEVQNLPPGTYAVHIHERGDCSAPGATSAGAHWNPGQEPHGRHDDAASHLGDLDNLKVAANGKGRLDVTSREWTIGTGLDTDVIGKAVVIHAQADDFVTQPSGASGERIACGVIEPRRDSPALSRR
jgi:Cu-Zn family superoxide dismutase